MAMEVPMNITSTTSLLVGDGTVIEQLRDGRMLLWKNGEQQVGSDVFHDEKRYVPAPLVPSLEAKLSFPKTAAAFDSLEELAEAIRQKWVSAVPMLEQSARECLVAGVFASWVVDCLPSPPVIVLEASQADCEILGRMLEALVRRPLILSNASVRELSKLEPSLCPTVILVQPSARTVEQLLPVLTQSQGVLLQDAACRQLRSAVWVITDKPLDVNGVTIAVPESESYFRMSDDEMRTVQDELHPKLLRYRLEHHLEVASSCFDSPELSSPLRMLARNLGCALEGSVGLQLSLDEALSTLDEQFKICQSMGDRAVVLESLLVLCHEGKQEAIVGEVAEVASDIRAARGDARKMKAKTAGSILRSLGLNAVRKNGGYTLAFSPDSKTRIHKLAAHEGALMLVDPKPDCPQCQPWLPKPEMPLELE
jgi:hypothetical protein